MKKSITIFAVTFVSFLLVYIPTFKWMNERWTHPNSYSSHGFFIPFISIWLLWNNRAYLEKKELNGSWWGFVFIFTGLTIHFLSGIARIHFTSGFSIPIVIAGIFVLFLGKKGLHWSWFAIFYLYCMIPFPQILISFFTLKLKLLASEMAVALLNFVGIICIRDGSIVSFTHDQMIVGDVCSGLRSLVAMIALSLPFAYITETTLRRKVFLVIILLPLALTYNILRVFFLGIVTYNWGSETVTGFIHDISGFVALFLNIITMLFISKSLEIPSQKQNSNCFSPPLLTSTIIKGCSAIGVFCIMAITTHFLLYKQYSSEGITYTQSFPQQFAKWYTVSDYPSDQRTIEILETKDLLTRHYKKPNTSPILLALVVSGNSNRKVSHPPEICYKGAGYEILQRTPVRLQNHDAILLRLMNNGHQEYAIYWYKFGSHYTANYYYHQANALMNFFQPQKGGVALIRISIRISKNPQKDFDTLQKFANEIYPVLSKYLP